jgi:hypothetical protein
MADPVSVGALIIAVMSGIGTIINNLHIRKCKSSCMESDCTQRRESDPQVSDIHVANHHIEELNTFAKASTSV